LNFEEYTSQEGMRTKHERRVVDDLRDLEFITRDYLVRTRRRGRAKKRNVHILYAKKPFSELGCQLNKESRAGVVVIPDQSQLQVAVPKLKQSFRTVTGNAYKLAEENQLDPRLTKRESHLPCGQKHAGEFG
jgi:hypothetical protein